MKTAPQKTESAPLEITLSELTKNYQDAESCDKDIFAEQRSNILLVAGEHYSKKMMKAWTNRLRDQKEITNDQKLRLTKNHTYKIMRSYANSVVSYAPSVDAKPQDSKSMQDVKQAELHHKVIQYFKHKYRMRERTRGFADDFTSIGEVISKIYFDPDKGELAGYHQEEDDQGRPLFDDGSGNLNTDGIGEPVSSERPMYSGDFVIEKVYGFNVLRPESCQDMTDAAWLTIRKMAPIADYKKKYAGQEEKLKCFEETKDGEYMIFDAGSATYGKSKNQMLVCETYYRPSILYPKGYFVFWTEHGIYEEGELPFGIFPIAYGAFDKFQTNPRGRSHIKVLRPFQAEINRAASKLAEHQVTLGDDKIVMQAGSKLQQGGILPGIRGLTVTGAPPQVLPGRDGSQFSTHVTSQIIEMYKASLVEEEAQELPAQLDAYTLLFRAAHQKKKFTIYTERFEQFLIDVYTILIELAREYISDDELQEAVGVDNIDNADDFRKPGKLCYRIELESQSDDVETKLGRQITMMQSLQYVGSQLTREDIGKFLQNMPYGNVDGCYDDMTLDYEMAQNLMLALDRGQSPTPNVNADHPYLAKALRHRTLKPDFTRLSPPIQNAYEMRIQWHNQQIALQAQQKLAMESDLIPAQGALVRCDVYVPDSKDPSKSVRLTLPSDSLIWLQKRIETQGSVLGTLNQLPPQDAINTGALAVRGLNAQGQHGPSVPVQPPGGMPGTPQQGPGAITGMPPM